MPTKQRKHVLIFFLISFTNNVSSHLAECVSARVFCELRSEVQVRVKPHWFVALVWMELLFQMPLAIALLYSYAQGLSWTRQLGLVYAVHVLTTMPPIFYHFESTLQPPHKYCVFGVYAPWVVMPTIMLARFALGAPNITRRRGTTKTSTAKKRI
jgi:hypothetical protein